jgi:hypothetical protein
MRVPVPPSPDKRSLIVRIQRAARVAGRDGDQRPGCLPAAKEGDLSNT